MTIKEMGEYFARTKVSIARAVNDDLPKKYALYPAHLVLLYALEQLVH